MTRNSSINRRSRRSGGVLFVLRMMVLALAVSGLQAQSHAQRPTEEEQLFQRRYDEAGRHLRRGNASQARRIYEDLLARKPDDRAVFIGYVTARISLFELDGLIDSVQSRIEKDPTDIEYILLLGDAQAAGGETERARSTWRSAIPLFEKPGEAYRRIAERMGRQRMVIEAIDFLLEGRRVTGSSNRFSRELVSFYELIGEGEKVADECVRAVMEGTMKEGELLRRLKELRADGSIRSYPYEELHGVLDSLPAILGIREALAGFYLDDGKCEEALREYEELDRSSPGCGNMLLPFARAAYGKNCFDPAGKALESVLKRCDRASIRIEAQFLLANVHRSGGSGDAAADVFRTLIRTTRNPGDLARARHDLAMVYLEDLGRANDAITVLGELLAMKDLSQYHTEARFALGRAHIVAGEYDKAAEVFTRIEEEAKDDDVRERAIYGQGQSRYYKGGIDDALADYRRIIDQYPTGRYLNDALEQSIFLTDHRDVGDAPLKVYTDCLLRIERHEYREARGTITEMIEALILSNLRNDFMWQLASIEEEEGNFPEAITQLDLMIDDYPMERLSREAEVKAADLLCNRLHDLPAGIARYEAFLVEHPESILADEVLRKKREAEKQNES